MSQITQIKGICIRNLQILALACNDLGVEFVKDKDSFNAGYGLKHICEHVIRAKESAYDTEIGVASRDDGVDGYALLWDTDAVNPDIVNLIGADAAKLRQTYSTRLTLHETYNDGYQLLERSQKADGTVLLRVVR